MPPSLEELEAAACTPHAVHPEGFNGACSLPYGLTTDHVMAAMIEFQEFLGFINGQLHSKALPRLESLMMQASFSGLVGEFASATIPKYCPGLARNRYHNGHPDMIPAGMFQNDAVQHATGYGIEVKASRYLKGWQGHNAERSWLMIFVYESSRPTDDHKGVQPIPFRYLTVVGAQLEESDWLFAGRYGQSRRTITASVTASGYGKVTRNWIYRDPCYYPTSQDLFRAVDDADS